MSEETPNPEASILKELSLVGPVAWDEVKAIWQNDEDTDAFRREYQEQGYESWEAWRRGIIEPLHLNDLNWAKYEIPAPLETVPKFKGGPFKPWQDRYYGGIESPTFAEVVKVQGTDVQSRSKFAEIIASDNPIQLIGLVLNGEIHIIEGMHRSTAIALAADRGEAFAASVHIILAQSDLPKLEIIG